MEDTINLAIIKLNAVNATLDKIHCIHNETMYSLLQCKKNETITNEEYSRLWNNICEEEFYTNISEKENFPKIERIYFNNSSRFYYCPSDSIYKNKFKKILSGKVKIETLDVSDEDLKFLLSFLADCEKALQIIFNQKEKAK